MTTGDQATRLRRLMRQGQPTLTISVASGKGGVGKSCIAANLAILLSAAGKRVALVDADLALANLDILLDVDVYADLSDVVAGTRRLDEVVIDLPCGVQFVPGASGLANLADLTQFEGARLLEELTALEEDNDIIIIDCGAGIGPDVLRFAGAADTALIVTSPEPTALADGYAMIKVLTAGGYEGRLRLVVNLTADRAEAKDAYRRISRVAEQFLGAVVGDGGYVVSDPKVASAVRRRQPVVLAYPDCPASRSLAGVAGKYCAGGGGLSGRAGFFRRVVGWLA